MPNEIELLVSIRRNGDESIKRRGDVLTCRLSGGTWGSEEVKFHQVVTWPSSNPTEEESRAFSLISLILNKKLEWGEPNPRIDFPFCEVVEESVEDDEGNPINSVDGTPLKRTSITNRSVIHFNFSGLPESQIKDILDENVEAKELSADNLVIEIDQRGIDKRDVSERGEKQHRDVEELNPILHATTALRRDETTNIQDYISQNKKN